MLSACICDGNKNDCYHKAVDKCREAKYNNIYVTEHFDLYVKYLISRKKILVCCSTFIKECINVQDKICVGWPCSSTADSNAHSFNSSLLGSTIK